MLTTPKRKPQEFGFNKNDTHMVVNAAAKVAKLFDFQGNLITQIPCLADGQHPNWRNSLGDTPPGLYVLGQMWNDYELHGDSPPFDRTLRSFGWITFDFVDKEGNEDNNGRAGVAGHGGGTGCGWPGAWEPFQPLYPTHGCVRFHNIHLRDVILPRYKMGTVFVSVYQDDV